MTKQMIENMLDTFTTIWAQNSLIYIFLGVLFLLTTISRLPMVKGWIGETIMRVGFNLFLPSDKYRVINNVTIPDDQGGTTQIDHVIVAVTGVFAVETKHYKCWIFGGERDRQWTQKIHGNHSQKFQNPLRQNYKHTECLRELLGLDEEHVKSLVVFTGEATLKTRDKLPRCVTYPGGCIAYIKGQHDPVFDRETVAALEQSIRENRLTPSWKTSREHVAYLRNSHADTEGAAVQEPAIEEPMEPEPEEDTTKSCPKCGAEMILRKARKGANVGNQFWGCSTYPKCRCFLNCD